MHRALLHAAGHNLKFVVFITIFIIPHSIVASTLESEVDDGDLFLPKSILPEEYFITIHPIEEGSTVFEGFVRILMRVEEPTDRIVFHMAGLNFLNGQPKVNRINGENSIQSIPIMGTSYDERNQMQTLLLGGKEPLSVGDSIEMSMNYVGTMVNNAFGLNAYSYIDSKGKIRRIMTTYFQPVGARRVFPCFDEPSLKAHFTLSISRKSDQKVLSNMPLKRSKQINSNNFMDEFEKSILMPTNVVAFVIHYFKSISKQTKNSKIVRVFGREDIIDDLRYVSQLSSKVISEYESLLGTPYPLQKLDIVAMPEYPVPGMENFGLIMSREKSLVSGNMLYGLEWSSIVTAHEIVHQWIGNQVTPHWWSHWWISEGFATYLAAVALEKLTPPLEAMNILVANHILWTKRKDEGKIDSVQLVSEPLNPIVSPSKGIHMYHKGAAVLRMLSYILGEDHFMTGVRDFFRKFAFKAASQYDLVATLSEAAGGTREGKLPFLPTSLHSFVKTWTHQGGYPMITVNRKNNGTIHISQVKFESIPASVEYQRANASWWIPLTLATNTRSSFEKFPPVAWLGPGQNKTIAIPQSDTWVVVNVDQLAYLRVLYDQPMWLAIINQLEENHLVIPYLNRVQLVDDAIYLYKIGQLDVELMMGVLQHLPKEENFYVWKTALDNLSYIALLMRGDEQYATFKDFMLLKLVPVLKRLEADVPGRDSHVNRKMRLTILSWICKFHHSICIERARLSFRIWKAQPTNLRIFPEYATEEFLCAALRSGNAEYWNFAFDQFLEMKKTGIGFERTDTSKEPKKFLVNALGCTKDENSVTRYLESLLDLKYNLTLDDGYNIINSLVRSENWGLVTMQFFKENFEALLNRFGTPPAPFITTDFDLQQFELLAKDLKVSHPEWSKDVISFLEDGKKHATKNAKMIKPISIWLRNYKSDFKSG